MARAARPVPDDPDEAAAMAYAYGLRLLSGRELAEADMRRRLAVRGFGAATVDAAVGRLTGTGALSDARAVRAVARTLVQVKRRGRIRARRELEARGFRPDDIAAALGEVFADVGEDDLIERALDAKLRGRSLDAGDLAGQRRVFAALVRRGFRPSAAAAAVRRRCAGARLPEPGDDDHGS